MTGARPPDLIANGWSFYFHPAFAGPFRRLVDRAEAIASANPESAKSHPVVRLVVRIGHILRNDIASDPASERFRLGNTLGPAHRTWARVRFNGRYRLFFRYSTARRVVIVCWLNDESTLRKAGSTHDPYAVFARMLGTGDPPTDWDALWQATSKPPLPK